MNLRIMFIAVVLSAALVGLAVSGGKASAQSSEGLFVVIVELEIDPAQSAQFKAAVKENGETAVRVEPGCREFNVVFEKDNPARVRLFEVYENVDAFKAHIETAHFKKYAEATKDIVKSRKRIENVSFSLNAKGK